MKKVILSLIIAVSTMISTVCAYDFSAVSPSGHTLYYEIISGATNVGVIRPGSGSTYNNYVSGNVVIPDTVSYNGTTYNVTEFRIVGTYGTFENCSSLTSITIPNSITSIGYSAFSGCSSLTSVTIPNSATSIEDYAFSGCSSLTSVTIPNSVTSIEDNAFNGCSSLTSVTIPNSFTSIGGSAFKDCNNLTAITIPNSVTSIGYSAFSGCSSLASVIINNGITSIGYSAFYGCSNLTLVTIPNSVTSIGNSAFSCCSSLTTLNFNAINCNDFSSNSSYHPFHNCPISTINIGDSVQRIPAYFAYNKTSLSVITIPNSITSIEDNAFSGCSDLATLNFNALNCSDFTSSTFSDSPISAITIGDSVEHIPAYFAYNKTAISEIIIPNSVTSIGSFAFNGCSSLDTIIISNNITTLGESTFQNCNNLVYAVLSENMSSIGNKAFYGCNSLHNVTSLASFPPTLGTEVFSATAILKVPCGSEAYYSVPPTKWSEYFISIEEVCNNITITVVSANENMGSVSGSGEYEIGTEVTITAIPEQGYRFVSWNDGNTENPRTITVEAEVIYIATFEMEEVCNNITITVVSANENMGSVSGSGEYEIGTEVTITATPKQGYRFVSWNDGNTENPRTIIVEAEAIYVATFEEIVGIEGVSMLDELSLYPNPTSGTITFSSTDICKVEIMDAMGRMVEVYNNSYIIDLSKLRKGYYTLRVITDRGVALRKVIRK